MTEHPKWLQKSAQALGALDTISRIIDCSKNIFIVMVGISSLAFFLFPSFQDLVRDKIKQESAWFYVGTWDQSRKQFRSDREHLVKFYFTNYDYNSLGLINNGTVLLGLGLASLGRTGPSPEYSAKTLVAKNQCIRVLESARHEGRGHSGTEDKSIWVRALPNAC